MQRSRAWELAFRIKPAATDCSWPSGSAIPSVVNRCIYTLCSKLLLVLFQRQAWYTHTSFGQFTTVIEFMPTLGKQFSYCSLPVLFQWISLHEYKSAFKFNLILDVVDVNRFFICIFSTTLSSDVKKHTTPLSLWIHVFSVPFPQYNIKPCFTITFKQMGHF